MQPAELIIIGGAASGTVLVADPLHILKQLVAGVVGVFKGSKIHPAILRAIVEDDVRSVIEGPQRGAHVA